MKKKKLSTPKRLNLKKPKVFFNILNQKENFNKSNKKTN